jgi:hypothetical protein
VLWLAWRCVVAAVLDGAVRGGFGHARVGLEVYALLLSSFRPSRVSAPRPSLRVPRLVLVLVGIGA